MKKFLLTTAALATMATGAMAETCTIATSHYVGWYPANWMQDSGLAAEVGAKHGVDLEVVFFNEYGPSIDAFVSGNVDGVTITTLDALIAPAASGVQTEIVVVGDFSNGNDAVLVIDQAGSVNSPEDLVGRDINLVMGSISEYLFDRWIQAADSDLTVADFNLVNTSDVDMPLLIANAAEGEVYVTWNPFVHEALEARDDIESVYDSSRIPAEIVDTFAMNADASAACKSAVADAWYQTMAVMSGGGADAEAMVIDMAKFAIGDDSVSDEDALDWYNAQLQTTNMFYTPADGIAISESAELLSAMESVYAFAQDRGMLTDDIGVQMPDGTVIGNADRIMMTFSTEFMAEAAN